MVLDELELVLCRAVRARWAGLRDGEVLDAVARLRRAGSQLSAVVLAGLAAAERLQAARGSGLRSTGAWLHSTGMRAGAAHREVALAHALGGLPATRDALTEGSISAEHAQVIAGAMAGLSAEVDDAGRDRVEGLLVEQAGRLDPTRLAKEAPGVARRVDPHAAARLARAECEARERRHLGLCRNRDGDVTLAGLLDAEGAATVSAALDPLAAPKPTSAGGPDPRRPCRRLADALVELARRALTGTDGAAAGAAGAAAR